VFQARVKKLLTEVFEDEAGSALPTTTTDARQKELKKIEDIGFNAKKLSMWADDPDNTKEELEDCLSYARIAGRMFIRNETFNMSLDDQGKPVKPKELQPTWPIAQVLESFERLSRGPQSWVYLDKLIDDDVLAAKGDTWLKEFHEGLSNGVAAARDRLVEVVQKKAIRLTELIGEFDAYTADEATAQAVKSARMELRTSLQKATTFFSSCKVSDADEFVKEAQDLVDVVHCHIVVWGLVSAKNNSTIFTKDGQAETPHHIQTHRLQT
jgi:hypothetical protein